MLFVELLTAYKLYSQYRDIVKDSSLSPLFDLSVPFIERVPFNSEMMYKSERILYIEDIGIDIRVYKTFEFYHSLEMLGTIIDAFYMFLTE